MQPNRPANCLRCPFHWLDHAIGGEWIVKCLWHPRAVVVWRGDEMPAGEVAPEGGCQKEKGAIHVHEG